MVCMSETHCVKNFPVTLFSSVMGMAGLSIAFQRYGGFFAPAHGIGVGLLALSAAMFLGISVVYSMKFLRFRQEVWTEWNHPIRANFFPAISIGLLLLSIASLELNRQVSMPLWLTGTVLHLFFTLMLISRWIIRNYEILHSNPTWFIPVVGNIIVPVAGVEFAGKELSWFFFSIGLFFWLSLFTIVFYRIIFHHQLPQKFIPTLFILIAPPAVGFVSYIKLTGSMDAGARVLLYIALFFVLLLASMARQFLQLKFFVSWWAYTFPMCAATIATILAARLLSSQPFVLLAGLLLAVSSVIIGIVFAKTLHALWQKKLCVEEE